MYNPTDIDLFNEYFTNGTIVFIYDNLADNITKEQFDSFTLSYTIRILYPTFWYIISSNLILILFSLLILIIHFVKYIYVN